MMSLASALPTGDIDALARGIEGLDQGQAPLTELVKRVEGAIDDLTDRGFQREASGRIGRDDVHHPVGHVREDDDLEVLVERFVCLVAVEPLLEVLLDEGVVFERVLGEWLDQIIAKVAHRAIEA